MSRKCEHGMMPWECAECDFKVKDHEIGIHVNNLRDIAVKYAETQQLRTHIRKEVYRFNKWTDS